MHTHILLRPGISYAEMQGVERAVCDLMYENGIIEARCHGRDLYILDTTDRQHDIFAKDTFLKFWGYISRSEDIHETVEA